MKRALYMHLKSNIEEYKEQPFLYSLKFPYLSRDPACRSSFHSRLFVAYNLSCFATSNSKYIRRGLRMRFCSNASEGVNVLVWQGEYTLKMNVRKRRPMHVGGMQKLLPNSRSAF